MSSRRVIGLAPFLDVASNVWRRSRPEIPIESIAVVQGQDFVFDESSIAAYGEIEIPVFVAIDNRYLNFKRLELMTLLRARGHRFDRIVGLQAVLGEGVTVGENALVGEGAVIGDGASVGNAAYIGARAVVGPGAVVCDGAWIEPGVILGARVKVGAQTSITSGIVVADGVEIGAQCVLAIPGLIRLAVDDRTYFHPAFPEPIRVLGGGG